MKKPLSDYSRSHQVLADNKLLERISDPAVRALFGQIIAERNRYRREVNYLKQHANIIIDKRPVTFQESNTESKIEVLPSITGLLTESEIIALVYSISEECMDQQHWHYTRAGQIKNTEYNTEIFPRGFMSAIQKIVNEVKSAS